MPRSWGHYQQPVRVSCRSWWHTNQQSWGAIETSKDRLGSSTIGPIADRRQSQKLWTGLRSIPRCTACASREGRRGTTFVHIASAIIMLLVLARRPWCRLCTATPPVHMPHQQHHHQATEICRLLNAKGGSRCHYKHCRFSHPCMRCRGDHPMSACPNYRRDEEGWAGRCSRGQTPDRKSRVITRQKNKTTSCGMCSSRHDRL